MYFTVLNKPFILLTNSINGSFPLPSLTMHHAQCTMHMYILAPFEKLRQEEKKKRRLKRQIEVTVRLFFPKLTFLSTLQDLQTSNTRNCIRNCSSLCRWHKVNSFQPGGSWKIWLGEKQS